MQKSVCLKHNQEFFGPEMIRYIKQMLKFFHIPLQDREDFLQEILYSVQKSLSIYDANLSLPKRWVNQIITHKVSHYKNKKYFYHEKIYLGLIYSESNSDFIIDSILTQKKIEIFLYKTLQELPHSLFMIVYLHDIKEFDMSDISKQLNIPLSTVYKWRIQALKELKFKLSKKISGLEGT